MKQYDHEPTISELLDQFQEEELEIPKFMPQIKIPTVTGVCWTILSGRKDSP